MTIVTSVEAVMWYSKPRSGAARSIDFPAITESSTSKLGAIAGFSRYEKGFSAIAGTTVR
ncbi:uncharacterized protein N7458_010423 [Penicillium daleae]|uniref:Uncharacterized protein n=1 Tax=Penicillium daleae TaxID=63821 RepID=A0AAD6BZP9_9EURO|nr:uncharacterized protein N7458_010423 [Penicillium daleae]KAJ5439425.1 hypothetical protein N7458_010423 [Penicillium daleae]